MPATYYHRHTYEQITGGGRSTWKMPRAEEPATTRIFGIDVDDSTFRKYNQQNYTIGFVFHDLAGVERWATDPDLAAQFPERAAEAKRIMEQIIAEITGKEDENMKEPRTAADFIAALSDIYGDSRKAYEALQERSDKAKTKMEAAEMEMKSPDCQDRSMAEALFNVAKAEYQLAESTRIREYREMHSGHGIKVAELREKFNDFLSELYSANPDSLDTATMQLLEYGIVKASDMVRLAERHKANPTMLRILGEHARKMRDSRKISYEDRDQLAVVIQKALAAADGSREQAIFDSAVNSMEYGLGNDYKHASRMHAYVVGWLDNFREQMETVFDNSAAANGGEGE